jgi:hypothetical protein
MPPPRTAGARSPPSLNLLRRYSGRQRCWKIGSAAECTHMPARLNDETRQLHENGRASRPPRFHCRDVLVEMRTEKLAQVGDRRTLPSDSKYGPRRRYVFAHRRSRRHLQLVGGEYRAHLRSSRRAHREPIGFDGRLVIPQRSLHGRRSGERDQRDGANSL